jgi:hypothetical protein
VKTQLSRRALLRGLGGIAIALPALEIMLDRHGVAYAEGGTIPKRFFVGFIGQALSGDGATTNLYVPNTVGLNYDLKLALSPLAEVKQHVTVVSGMEIMAAAQNGGVVPAGGRVNEFHASSLSPLFSGTKSTGSGATCNGPSADQLVATAIGDTKVRSLVLECPVDFYIPGYTAAGRQYMSYSAARRPIEPTISPKQAFESLFGNFVETGPTADPEAEFDRRARKSILDLTAGNTDRLMKKLGKVDQERLGAHLEQIRELERRIAALPPAITQTCRKATDPGADPAINLAAAYSGEKDRARIFGDLVHLAYACDLTRVATLMYSMPQSHMNAGPVTNGQYNIDLHELGHSIRTPEAVASGMVWQVEAFARLVKNLQDTPEGAGNMLDNCALLLLNEAGHGNNYEETPVKPNATHSTEKMACLIAGRAGGLKPGKHIVTNKAHPAQVTISAMKAVGLAGDTLGEVNGSLPQLFV